MQTTSTQKPLDTANFSSPIGELYLAASNEGLCELRFEALTQSYSSKPKNQHLTHAIQQLAAYFNGELKEFKLTLDLRRGTTFQRKVWDALQQIPYGTTCSYQAIAIKIDSPQAVRAVGGANNVNPLPLIIPCHRVIGATGKLVGYGGGLEKKQWLLKHESAQTSDKEKRAACFS